MLVYRAAAVAAAAWGKARSSRKLLSTPQFPPITGKHFTRKGFCFNSNLNSRSSTDFPFIHSLNMNKQFANSLRSPPPPQPDARLCCATTAVPSFRIKRIWMEEWMAAAACGSGIMVASNRASCEASFPPPPSSSTPLMTAERWDSNPAASNNGNEFEINWK